MDVSGSPIGFGDDADDEPALAPAAAAARPIVSVVGSSQLRPALYARAPPQKRQRQQTRRFNHGDYRDQPAVADEALGSEDSYESSDDDGDEDLESFIASDEDDEPSVVPDDSSGQYEHNNHGHRRRRKRPPVRAPDAVPHSAILGPPPVPAAAAAAAVASSLDDSEMAKRIQSADARKRAMSYYHGPLLRGEQERRSAAIANDPEPAPPEPISAASSRDYDGLAMVMHGDSPPPPMSSDSDAACGSPLPAPANDLQMALASLNRKSAIAVIDFEEASHRMHTCKLCGFMELDEEKHDVAAIAAAAGESGEAAALLLMPDQQGAPGGAAGGGGGGKIEDYRFADIARIVCQHVSRMNPWDCCVLASIYYHNNVYRKTGGTVPKLSVKDIYDHFFGRPCVMDPRLQCISLLRVSARLASEIQDGMMVQNAATGERYADSKQVKSFTEICKTMRELYTWDTKNMRFYAPEMPIDTDISNALILPGRCLRRTSRKQRHAGAAGNK